MKIAFLFSGQGSQYFQMGRTLLDREPAFARQLRGLDAAMRDLTRRSVIDFLYAPSRAPGDPFVRTAWTHPAIFMVELALAQALIEQGIYPDVCVGVSLGAFAAATIAGRIAAEDALRAVVRQAELVEEYAQPGGMIAVLASATRFEHPLLFDNADLAAVNFSSHFVISARDAQLRGIGDTLTRWGVAFTRLAVSQPFHSRWIEDAQRPFEAFFRTLRFKSGGTALMCCEQAAAIGELPSDHFWRAARGPIRFRETIERLEGEGPYRYIDVGPGGTLSTLLKYILPPHARSQRHAIMTPFNEELNLLAELHAAVARDRDRPQPRSSWRG